MRAGMIPEKSPGGGIVGIILFAVPVLLFCWGSVVTLRSESARQWVMGG